MIEGLGSHQDALRGLLGSRVSEVTERFALESEDSEVTNEAGEAFESYFATMLVKELRRALPDGLFQGAGSDVYTAWFDEHVGATLSNQDALGIGAMIRAAVEPKGEILPAEELVENPIASDSEEDRS